MLALAKTNTTRSFSVALLLSTLASADPAFYCELKSNEDFKRYGDLQTYEECGELCDCYVFELLCLYRASP